MALACDRQPTIGAVLFDLDDTLFDHSASTRLALDILQSQFPAFEAWTLEEFERRHAALLEAFHLEVLGGRMSVDEARLARFGRLAADAGPSGAGASPAKVALAYRDAYVSAWRQVPGARELLMALRKHARLGIVTNNIVVEQRQKIDACGFASLVDAVVISEEFGVAKPDPRIFAECLARLGASADRSVMVGDSWPSDIVGARAAGIRAIWFNRTGMPVPDGSAITELVSLEPAGAVTSVMLRAGLPGGVTSVRGQGTP